MSFSTSPLCSPSLFRQVGFNDGAETLETEEDPEAGPKRSAHGRKATAFVPKARAAPGVAQLNGWEEPKNGYNRFI